MLCAQKSLGLCKTGFVYELKLDGVRIIAEKDEARAYLTYRSSRDAAPSYPEVREALLALPFTRVVFDGEIVAFDDTGRPSFGRLQDRIGVRGTRDIAQAAMRTPVAFVVFDLLELEGLSLLSLPLSARKQVLAAVTRGVSIITTMDGMENDGTALFALCQERGMEGVVGKRLSSVYTPGARTNDWFKAKAQREGTFLVVGYTLGEGGRGRLGALELAERVKGQLVWRGRVGSGFTEAQISALLKTLAPLAVSEAPLAADFDKKERVWTRPDISVRVRYLELSEEGRLRFPVFAGVA